MFTNWKSFSAWEKTNEETIFAKKIYIDIADDFMAGVLLSRIVYWYLPDQNGKTKLRVKKECKKSKKMHYWIAKSRDEWFEEIRFSKNNYLTAMKKLQDKKIIIRQDNMFKGKRTPHIRLNIPVFLELLNNELAAQMDDIEDDFEQYLADEASNDAGCPETGQPVVRNADDRLYGNQPTGCTESGQRITESTTEITSQSTTKNLSIQQVDESSLPDDLKAYVKQNIDRLIDKGIKVEDIENNFLVHKNNQDVYLAALDYALNEPTIKNLAQLMQKNIDWQLKNKSSKQKKPKNDEVIPGWFPNQEKQEPDAEQNNGYNPETMAERIERLRKKEKKDE